MTCPPAGDPGFSTTSSPAASTSSAAGSAAEPASAPARLRQLLAAEGCHAMPCCFDGLSARLVQQAGFPLTFMSGFSVAAARAALPDTGLLSVSEMLDQGRSICGAVSIPVIGDGDTGHGNPANVQRSVREFARAGFAGIMLEDQLAPKRCGHTGVREVVERPEALRRIRAAVEARDALRATGGDLVIVARTDARSALAASLGEQGALEEALWRLQAFADLGAEVLFLEAPRSLAEMERCCAVVPGWRMANMLEGGLTPLLPPEQLAAIGFRLAAYPLTLVAAAAAAMRSALADLAAGRSPAGLMPFAELRQLLGFDAYDALLERYDTTP